MGPHARTYSQVGLLVLVFQVLNHMFQPDEYHLFMRRCMFVRFHHACSTLFVDRFHSLKVKQRVNMLPDPKQFENITNIAVNHVIKAALTDIKREQSDMKLKSILYI